MDHFRHAYRKLTPFQIITVSFSAVIFLGSLLLYIPLAAAGKGKTSYLDALFTSCSAVCVTGLVTQNTATYWSMFGKAVILGLIQIGGLGVVTVIIAVSIFTGKRIGLRQRNLMQNAVNAPQIGGIIRFTRFLLFFTLAAEVTGAFCLAVPFIRDYGVGGGIWRAVFHSISAFCNAGFDLLGEKVHFSSLTAYHADLLVNVVIMSLIVIGGLGFVTWEDLIVKRFGWKKLRLQTKVILVVSPLLILIPAFLMFLFEFRTGSAGTRILASLFQSVTTRTAGFNTMDIGSMGESAKLLMIVLMLIGGSPGSTAGGLKTTTFFVVLIAAIGFLRQKKNVCAFGRTISSQIIWEAFTLLMLYIFLLLSGTMVISTIEKLPVVDCMFECASALGTVGLTVGITSSLSGISKIILIGFMYFGRVGGLTLAYAALSGRRGDDGRLPEEKIMVG